MFEPISALAGIQLGFTALYSLARSGSAISPEAQNLQRTATSMVYSIERSQALFGDKATAISQLWALANECGEHGWDGNGASPIDQQTVCNAVAFIRALPDRVPLPEFAAEPDGAISLDWIKSRSRLFSLSINSSNRLACAWLDGTDRGHFVARIVEGRIPQRILDAIEAIMNDGNAALGA